MCKPLCIRGAKQNWKTHLEGHFWLAVVGSKTQQVNACTHNLLFGLLPCHRVQEQLKKTPTALSHKLILPCVPAPQGPAAPTTSRKGVWNCPLTWRLWITLSTVVLSQSLSLAKAPVSDKSERHTEMYICSWLMNPYGTHIKPKVHIAVLAYESRATELQC